MQALSYLSAEGRQEYAARQSVAFMYMKPPGLDAALQKVNSFALDTLKASCLLSKGGLHACCIFGKKALAWAEAFWQSGVGRSALKCSRLKTTVMRGSSKAKALKTCLQVAFMLHANKGQLCKADKHCTSLKPCT